MSALRVDPRARNGCRSPEMPRDLGLSRYPKQHSEMSKGAGDDSVFRCESMPSRHSCDPLFNGTIYAPVLTRALDAPLKRGNAALPTDHSTRTTAGHRSPNEGRSLYETPGHHLKHPCVGDCARGDGRNTGASRQQSLPTTVI